LCQDPKQIKAIGTPRRKGKLKDQGPHYFINIITCKHYLSHLIHRQNVFYISGIHAVCLSLCFSLFQAVPMSMGPLTRAEDGTTNIVF
jgi:hypothetical protein